MASGRVHYEIDAATGEELRRFEISGALSLAACPKWLVGLTFRDVSLLYCISLESGRVVWEKRDGNNHGRSAAFGEGFGLAADRVVVGRTDGSICAFNLSSGEELWRRDVTILDRRTGQRVGSVNQDAAIVIDGDRVLLEVWPWGACALALGSGEVLWQWQGYIPVQAYLYRDRYYVLGQVGQITVLDPQTGAVLCEGSLPRTYSAKAAREIERLCDPMLVSESYIWVGSESGHVVAFERETLAYAWHGQAKKASTHFFGSAFVSVNGRLYYGDQAFGINCMEEVSATDPILAASRAAVKARPGKKRKTR